MCKLAEKIIYRVFKKGVLATTVFNFVNAHDVEWCGIVDIVFNGMKV